jgi:antitoxin (DNA-binding transcriptional repressor) of toxin-antitoxin stability system
MKAIGRDEFNRHFDACLREVESGEEYLLTRDGKVVARVKGEASTASCDTTAAVEETKALRHPLTHRLNDEAIRASVEEGRRF